MIFPAKMIEECYKTYENGMLCTHCERKSKNEEVTYKSCKRAPMPDRSYKGPKVDYANDPAYADRPWPAL